VVHDRVHLCFGFYFYLVGAPPDGVPLFFCLGDLLSASKESDLSVSALGLDDLEAPDSAEVGLGCLL
jgi:hypothetical protein